MSSNITSSSSWRHGKKEKKTRKQSIENDYACSKVENITQFVIVYSRVPDVLVEIFLRALNFAIFSKTQKNHKILYPQIKTEITYYICSFFKPLLR